MFFSRWIFFIFFAAEAIIISWIKRLIVSFGIKSFGFSKIVLLVQELKKTKRKV
jgi:hypothetical protein